MCSCSNSRAHRTQNADPLGWGAWLALSQVVFLKFEWLEWLDISKFQFIDSAWKPTMGLYPVVECSQLLNRCNWTVEMWTVHTSVIICCRTQFWESCIVGVKLCFGIALFSCVLCFYLVLWLWDLRISKGGSRVLFLYLSRWLYRKLVGKFHPACALKCFTCILWISGVPFLHKS